jgi:Zn-dependent protease
MMLGRLTLNPAKHVDPVGTLVVPILLLVMHLPVFGWAKPVPVTWDNLKKPKRDMALVAAAGPGANLLMALAWAVVMRVGIELSAGELVTVGRPLAYMGFAGIQINIVLMVLNLLPLPPLDGGRILTGILPGPLAWKVSRIEPYGFIILLGLLATGLLGRLIGTPIDGLRNVIVRLVGL